MRQQRHPTTAETIRNCAEGWAHYGFLPSDIEVRDLFPLPIPHAAHQSRWCIFLTFSPQHDRYIGEYYTQTEANRAAGQFRRTLYAAYDAALLRRRLSAVAS